MRFRHQLTSEDKKFAIVCLVITTLWSLLLAVLVIAAADVNLVTLNCRSWVFLSAVHSARADDLVREPRIYRLSKDVQFPTPTDERTEEGFEIWEYPDSELIPNLALIKLVKPLRDAEVWVDTYNTEIRELAAATRESTEDGEATSPQLLPHEASIDE